MFRSALAAALALREAAFDKPYYRLVYGDSDTLPGLVVDRFGDYLVVQLNNAGLERYREPLLQALIEVVQPAGILLRADSRSRREQGLPEGSEVAFGEVPAAGAPGGKRGAFSGAGFRRPEDRVVLTIIVCPGRAWLPGCQVRRCWMSTVISAAGECRRRHSERKRYAAWTVRPRPWKGWRPTPHSTVCRIVSAPAVARLHKSWRTCSRGAPIRCGHP